MGWWHAARERVESWCRAGARNRELDDEIAHHLQTETDRLVREGMTSADARRAALVRFGDPVQIAESTRLARGRPPLEGNMQDLRYAFRSLWQHAGFTAIALITLALGLGATFAAFAVVDTVLLRPLRYRDADRLVYLREITATHTLNPPSHPNVVDWRARARSFDGLASAMFPATATVRSAAGADPLRVTTMGVSRGFFRTLGVTPTEGREFTDDENLVGGQPVVMVSHEFWQTVLNRREPLGDIIVGGTRKAVVGVLPAGFTFVTAADVYLPHEQTPGTCRTCRNYMVVARLAPGVDLASARAEMRTIAAAMLQQYGTDIVAVDVDVRDLREQLVGDSRTLLAVVFGAAALVWLIACTNLLSAQLARGWVREPEMLVRGALGASRARLLRQLTLESVVLVACGAALGLLLASVLTHVVIAVGAGQLPRLNEIALDVRVVIFAMAMSAATVLGVGIYPAIRLSRPGAAAALRASRATGVAVRASAWRLLLGFEIALAVALSIGSILLVRTVSNILNADTGFAPRGLLTASITPSERDVHRLEDARVDLAALPGVDGVAYTTRLPLGWGANSGPVRRRTDPPGPAWPAMAGFRMVSPDYFQVLKQPVVKGRAFAASDRANGEPVAIITPGIAATLWPGEDPIGRTIGTNYLWDEWLTVVGVVAEASNWSQPKGAQNEIYVPYEQHMHALGGQGQVVAMIRTSGDAEALASRVRESLRQTLPDSPALFRTMENRIERSAADRRFAMLAMSAFAVVALVLAAIGIYGVVWYIVATREREIGVRMALGATPGSVLRAILGGAAGIAVTGSVVGSVAALLSSRVLEASLFGISRNDPVTYVISVVGMLLAVLAGAWIPARRASRVDPLVAMRSEG